MIIATKVAPTVLVSFLIHTFVGAASAAIYKIETHAAKKRLLDSRLRGNDERFIPLLRGVRGVSLLSLPLNRRRRFGADVVDDAVDAFDIVDDQVRGLT